MTTAPIVTAAWLHAQISNSSGADIAVVDCRFALADPDWGRHQYDLAHILSAHYFDLNRDLSSPVREHGGRHPLPDEHTFGDKLAALGIGDRTLVVAYDDSRFAFAARLWWLLRYYGHDRVAVLDGGYQQWIAGGYPVTSDVPALGQRGNFQPQPQPEWIVDRQGVQAIQASAAHVLIDSREPDRYLGKTEPIDPAAGHIPGAVNYPWQDASTPTGFFLSVESQQQRWAAISPNVPVVYCGSGVTACVNLLSLAVAGIEGAKLYPGSWSDWCSSKNQI